MEQNHSGRGLLNPLAQLSMRCKFVSIVCQAEFIAAIDLGQVRKAPRRVTAAGLIP
jgi:hypothetical protein